MTLTKGKKAGMIMAVVFGTMLVALAFIALREVIFG